MKMSLFTICMLTMVLNLSACHKNNESNNTQEPHKAMKLKITIGTQEISATLYDNPTARDFASMLPITVTLEDYAGTEKINYLPRKLSTQNAPSGFTPTKSDITYYAPWGNLAVFYKDFSYSSGLISIGKIDSNGIAILETSGTITAKFEIIEQ